MSPEQPNFDPAALGLQALAATLGEERRARRFLDVTGIGTEDLRRQAGQPSLLAALITFLEAHEPDLLSVAAQIGVTPEALVAARHQLESGEA